MTRAFPDHGRCERTSDATAARAHGGLAMRWPSASTRSSRSFRAVRTPPRSSSSTAGVRRSPARGRHRGERRSSRTPGGRSSASTSSATARRPSPTNRRPTPTSPPASSTRCPTTGRLDAVGFSLGRHHAPRAGLPRAPALRPARGRRASVATSSSDDPHGRERILAAVEGTPATDDVRGARRSRTTPRQPGNDPLGPGRGAAAPGRALHDRAPGRRHLPGAGRPRRPGLRRSGEPAGRGAARRPPRHAAQHRPLRHAGVVRLHRRHARVPGRRAGRDGAAAGDRRAVDVLRAGGLVAFPTETVYGLGADAAQRRGGAAALRGEGPAGRATR